MNGLDIEKRLMTLFCFCLLMFPFRPRFLYIFLLRFQCAFLIGLDERATERPPSVRWDVQPSGCNQQAEQHAREYDVVERFIIFVLRW